MRSASARMEASHVFKLPLHSPAPPLPPEMQHLRAADVIMQVQCMKVAMVTHAGNMFALMPPQQGRISLLAPSGAPIEELPACNAAVVEYITGATTSAIGKSQKLADYLKQH